MVLYRSEWAIKSFRIILGEIPLDELENTVLTNETESLKISFH